MNSRAVSLPDLAGEKRRNTALSLTEGFTGAGRQQVISSSAQNIPAKPTLETSWDDPLAAKLNAVLPIYYRTRQLVLTTEKSDLRAPRRLQSELRTQEQALCQELRPLHPLFFQRFDNVQLERLVRAMPFLKLSQGRWIFGAESLAEAWPQNQGDRAFILLYGRISLFSDPSGAGDRTDLKRGDIFGERKFRICDETVRDYVGGAAYCEEPTIIGCLSSSVLESAFSDRAFGNKRIAQMSRTVPSFKRIVQADDVIKPIEDTKSSSKGMEITLKKKDATGKAGDKGEEAGGAIQSALRDLSKVATTLQVRPGEEVLLDEPLEETMLIVAKGQLQVKADLHLVERLEALPPKKSRLRVIIEKAQGLQGDTFLNKISPYVVCKMGEFKKVQTPVCRDAGKDPRFDFTGVLQYKNEPELEFFMMSRNSVTADDQLGMCKLPLKKLPDGWSGTLQLMKEKEGALFGSEDEKEPAGTLFVRVTYDFEKVNAFMKKPKERSWKNYDLFLLEKLGCWGHEILMLGPLFRKILESCSNNLKYAVRLGSFRLMADSQKGFVESAVVWKVTKQRFMEFTRHSGREKQFVQACRISAMEKSTTVKEHVQRLIKRWEAEEQMDYLRSGAFMKGEQVEEAMDPSRFKMAFKGVRARISVRNGLNITTGSWWGKTDPYVKVRFRGGKTEFRTKILQDPGADPVWDNEGAIIYQGETSMEFQVYDYDQNSSDDLIAVGVLQLEQFCNGGFEGMIELKSPGPRKKKQSKPMMLVVGVMWDTPRDLGTSLTGTSIGAALGRTA
eukprot:TRINITY_DN32216_c0_g1_i1.p1 TRINITY_DN32216_c0_g1~~TRINITY_DN32216_c0_g1_i1.p1  ORF type:complete len:786 (+),score=234.59 TRINITY_DN32216_c0_g1_i1:142-2499(+)